MSENTYIVFDDGSNKRKLYGKDQTVDKTIANAGLSEFDIYKRDRMKIRNLVTYDEPPKGDQLYCSLCKTRRTSMTKDQLLSTYTNNTQQIDKVNNECIGGQSYLWCASCGNIGIELETHIVPVRAGPFQCVKCQFSPENGGRIKTYSPKLMYQDPNDQKSKKLWYWECSLCHYRELMLKSNLKRTYVEPKSFVRSLESSLDRSRKKLLNKEDVEDIEVGLGGTPTSLVDSRDIEYNG